jgi:hypothetical protein
LARGSQAATITVNSLADPGAPGICALRDAITAAITSLPQNGCLGRIFYLTIARSLSRRSVPPQPMSWKSWKFQLCAVSKPVIFNAGAKESS